MSEYATGCGGVTTGMAGVESGSWIGCDTDGVLGSRVSMGSVPDTASAIIEEFSLWLCSGAEEGRGRHGVPKMDCTHEATFWSASCGWCTPSAVMRMA